MSVGELFREIRDALFKLSIGVIAWILIAPVAKLMPKRRDYVAVIGKHDGKFLDNAKYFFLQGAPLLSTDARVVFLTERRDVSRLLAGTGYEILLYPSWRSIVFLMRTGTVICDSSEWVKKLRRFLLAGSKKVQLWHGVGYKRIEFDRWRNEVQGSILSAAWMPAIRPIMKVIYGRVVRYDAVNATSVFYRDEVFKPAMLSHHFLAMGYPRNSFGELGEPARTLAWKNVDQSVATRLPDWMTNKRRIVLVAPTYKDTRASLTGFDAATVSMLDEFAGKNKIEFVFKFHTMERGISEVRGEHLHLCDTDSDLYPLMPGSSALITDYSSIYMDYLLLDKPVLFLVPDLEEYLYKDRQFQFDFEEMTPGPKLASWGEVFASLTAQWAHDDYAAERARLRRLAFDDLPQDQAVPGLIAFMRSQGWIPPARRGPNQNRREG